MFAATLLAMDKMWKPRRCPSTLEWVSYVRTQSHNGISDSKDNDWIRAACNMAVSLQCDFDRKKPDWKTHKQHVLEAILPTEQENSQNSSLGWDSGYPGKKKEWEKSRRGLLQSGNLLWLDLSASSKFTFTVKMHHIRHLRLVGVLYSLTITSKQNKTIDVISQATYATEA